MKWKSENQAEFILAAYKETEASARAIRGKQHTNAQLGLTLLVLASAFLLTGGSQIPDAIRVLSAVGFAMLGALLVLVGQVHASHLLDVLQILGRLEDAMQFHTPGAYMDRSLYGAATPAKLTKNVNGTGNVYSLLIIMATFYAITASLFPLLIRPT